MNKGNFKHGKSHSQLWKVWALMRERCHNPKNKSYKWYGGKCIKVCEEWNDYLIFEKWALSNGYIYIESEKRGNRLSIDRIDPDGNYEPSNCRWVTLSKNVYNAHYGLPNCRVQAPVSICKQVQHTPSGKIFRSIADASKFAGITPQNVSKICWGKFKRKDYVFINGGQ